MSDKLVKTTKAQKNAEIGSTPLIDKAFLSKKLNLAEISKPIKVVTKCKNVKVVAYGKPEVYASLLAQRMPTDETKFRAIYAAIETLSVIQSQRCLSVISRAQQMVDATCN